MLRNSQWFVLMVSCFLLGCGGGETGGPQLPEGPKGSAKATVVYDGKPITTGTLILDSQSGYIASGVPGPDGTFELKGPKGAEVPTGKYLVGITPPPAPVPAPGATEMPGPPTIEGVPEKFYNGATSGVTVEIKEGSQQLEIVLE